MSACPDISGPEVENALFDLGAIETAQVDCSSGLNYAGRPYVALARCCIVVGAESYPVVIGVPEDWDTRLFDFYLQGYAEGFPHIPHVEGDGKLCLLDLDSVLIDFDGGGLRGLLAECAERAAKLIGDGLSRANERDFIGEFEAYWARLCGEGQCILDVPLSEGTRTIHTVAKDGRSLKGSRKDRRKSKRQGGAANKQPQPDEEPTVEVACSISPDSEWGWGGTMRNGAYFSVCAEEPLYPPDFRERLSLAYVNGLLSLVPASDARRIVKKCKAPFTGIFHIKEPDGKLVDIAVHVKAGELMMGEGCLSLRNDAEVVPLSVRRVDRETLMGRVAEPMGGGVSKAGEGMKASCLEGKKVLIVGCGSIGGYVAVMLAKAGCDRITLVDHDKFSEENVFRHVLGKESIGKSKVIALKDRLMSAVPGMRVDVFGERIEQAVRNGSVDLRRFDIIISATGNHTSNIMLDRVLLEMRVTADAFFAWNEPFDIGCHAAFVPGRNYAAEGEPTLRGLFGRDEGGLCDLTSYCERGQRFERGMCGCCGLYVPYGDDVSVKSSLLVVGLVKRALSGRLSEGVVVSEKGDGYWFGEAGFRTSAAYGEQADLRSSRSIASFAGWNCKKAI